MTSAQGSTCIVGVGRTAFGRLPGRSSSSLAAEAVLAAAADAGIDPRAIDGLIPAPTGATAEDVASSLGLEDLRFTSVSHMGGASCVASIRTASLAVAAGAADYVAVFIGRNAKSGTGIAGMTHVVPGQQFRYGLERPHGVTLPAQWYAFLCRRHMHEFGTTKEQMGTVALTMRANAQQDARSQMHGRPMSMEDYLGARPIVEPYGLLDCCIQTDGGAAFIVTTEERARATGRAAARVLGVAEGHAPSPDDLVSREPFLATGLRAAAPRAFAMAGLAPSDVDAAMIYDCFTFEVIHQLEEAGFCERGAGGPFVGDGHIAPDGSLPVNTHGGSLSDGHVSGFNHVIEAVDQVRGEAGNRQLARHDVVAVTGWGDMGDGSIALLGRGREVSS